MTTRARCVGALVGLAVGDALGTTVEFRPRGTFEPLTTLVGGGPFHLQPGQWTDDTSMALCLAESLVACGFDPLDQMQRYLRWWRTGHWSSTGVCFDIGHTTAAALRRFELRGDPFAGSPAVEAAGNGSLMRLVPVALRFAHDPPTAVRHAAGSSRTTHAAQVAIDACRYFAGLLVGALHGHEKAALLAPHYAPPGVDWHAEPLAPDVAAIAAGAFAEKSAREIQASGYVLHTLEAALWAFARTDCFRDGALLAVNLGEDADTTGAVYGQLAGAYYGLDGIPDDWRQRLHRRDDIERLASDLFALDAASAGASQ